jgi:hypothetical protein
MPSQKIACPFFGRPPAPPARSSVRFSDIRPLCPSRPPVALTLSVFRTLSARWVASKRRAHVYATFAGCKPANIFLFLQKSLYIFRISADKKNITYCKSTTVLLAWKLLYSNVKGVIMIDIAHYKKYFWRDYWRVRQRMRATLIGAGIYATDYDIIETLHGEPGDQYYMELCARIVRGPSTGHSIYGYTPCRRLWIQKEKELW